MKTKYLFTIFSLALLFGACKDSRVDKHEKELRSLRQEIREVAQLQYEFNSLKEKLDRGEHSSPEQAEPSPNAPLFGQTLDASGSHRDDPFHGPKDADLVIMAFADYECVPCMAFFKQALPQLLSEFVDTEKVKFIFRDFPLSSKSHSRQAARLAHCAGEKGHYWEMFDTLYENQELVSTGNFKSLLEIFSKKIPLAPSSRELLQCSESLRYEKELQLDTEEAKSLGARGAPSFFIARRGPNETFKGVFVRGAQPYPVLRAQILKLEKEEK